MEMTLKINVIYEHTFSISDQDCLPADGEYPHLAYEGDVVLHVQMMLRL